MLNDLTKLVNPAFYSAFWARNRFLILKGGAGSGKSFFAAQKVVIRTMMEAPHTFLIIRKVAATLRNSVFALIQGIISQWGIANMFVINYSDMAITFIPNGNQILFSGLDDAEKIKSITGRHGFGLTGIWIEEATELTPEDVNQLNLRLRGNLPQYKQLILSFNPISERHHLKVRFFDQQRDDAFIHHSTYRDNVLMKDPEYCVELERLAEIDPALYKIYALGEWGSMKGLIFGNWASGLLPGGVEADETIYGLDFGFNNPMALVKIQIQDRRIFVSQLIYRRKMTTEQLIEELPAHGISSDDPIYCDSAEPDRIQALYDSTYNAMPAKKGQGSVTAGIVFVKSLEVIVDPAADEIWAEQSAYKWREDKNGNILDEPADFNNHAMDAIRYATFTHLQDSSYAVNVL